MLPNIPQYHIVSQLSFWRFWPGGGGYQSRLTASIIWRNGSRTWSYSLSKQPARRLVVMRCTSSISSLLLDDLDGRARHSPRDCRKHHWTRRSKLETPTPYSLRNRCSQNLHDYIISYKIIITFSLFNKCLLKRDYFFYKKKPTIMLS